MPRDRHIHPAVALAALLLLLALAAFPAASLHAGVLWHQSVVSGDVYYLPQSNPNRIQRYDLTSRQWLAPVALAEAPTAFAMDGSHAFVASGRKIERIALGDGSKVHVANTTTDVIALFVDGSLLLANQSSATFAFLRSFDRVSFSPLDAFEYYGDTLLGSSISRQARRILGRRVGISPPDITFADYSETGQFLGGGHSPYHGAYPDAARTFVFPDGNRVVDSSGTVYDVHNLRYSNSFGLDVVDIGFHGSDVPVVLSGFSVHAFTNTLLPVGERTLDVQGRALRVHGDRVFVFAEDANEPGAVLVRDFPMEDLAAPEPGEPISPEGLAYEVGSLVLGGGIVYLASEAHAAVFRWDATAQRYLQSLVLPEAPLKLEFDSVLNRLYAYAPSRRIYRFDLAQATPVAVPHATLPVPIDTLVSLQGDLMAAMNESVDAQWIYGEDGGLLAEQPFCCYTRFHFYDAPRNRLYLNSHRVPYLGGGQFGDLDLGSGWGFSPIQISHDGLLLIDDAGVLYRSEDRQPVDALSNDVAAAQWLSNGALLSVRKPEGWPWAHPPPSTTTAQRWSGTYALLAERTFPGAPVALLRHGVRGVLVTSHQGVPRFTVLDSVVGIVPPAQLDRPALRLEAATVRAVRVGWDRVQGAAGYRIERRRQGAETWQALATLGHPDDTYLDLTAEGGRLWHYRLVAFNGGLFSDVSETLTVDLRPQERVRIDPHDLPFLPADVRLTHEGEIALLSPEHASVFLWDPRRQTWSGSIPLAESADRMTGPLDNGTLVVQYLDGSLGAVDTGLTPSELPFAPPADVPCGLAAAGNFLVACTEIWMRFVSHDLLGERRPNSLPWQSPIGPSAWRAGQRQLIYLEDLDSPSLRRLGVGSNGALSQLEPGVPVSGGHGVLRMNPQGSLVVLGEGVVRSAATFDFVASFGYPIDDAAWLGSDLALLEQNRVSLRAHPDAHPHHELELEFPASRLQALADGRLVVVGADDQGRPVMLVLDAMLSPVEPPIYLSGFEAERSTSN
jgi:hypothetical protein